LLPNLNIYARTIFKYIVYIFKLYNSIGYSFNCSLLVHILTACKKTTKIELGITMQVFAHLIGCKGIFLGIRFQLLVRINMAHVAGCSIFFDEGKGIQSS
jgi:hypothetical protein